MGVQGETEDLQSKLSLQSLEEKETILPCHHKSNGDKLVQVSWFKINPDKGKDQMIIRHHTEGTLGRYNYTVLLDD